jgi:hypothetical protein
MVHSRQRLRRLTGRRRWQERHWPGLLRRVKSRQARQRPAAMLPAQA